MNFSKNLKIFSLLFILLLVTGCTSAKDSKEVMGEIAAPHTINTITEIKLYIPKECVEDECVGVEPSPLEPVVFTDADIIAELMSLMEETKLSLDEVAYNPAKYFEITYNGGQKGKILIPDNGEYIGIIYDIEVDQAKTYKLNAGQRELLNDFLYESYGQNK